MSRTQNPLDVFSVTGRVAVVTGSASGLGRAIAILLARTGSKLVLADIDKAGADETAGMISDLGGAAIARTVDVTDAVAVDGLAAAALEAFSRIDIWVNVAGTVMLSAVVETPPDKAAQVLAVNALGVQNGCAAAGRAMKDTGGAIVNISSAGGELPVPGMATYCMSKAAVNQLTRVCAMELGTHRIRVNAVAPGWIETPMSSAVFRTPEGEIDPEARKAYMEQQTSASPLGILGSPDDIAHAVLYLASDASRFITGQILTVNGGTSM